MTWAALPDKIVDIRRRWRHAQVRIGPWSRHPESIGLLARAREDVATLLTALDTTQGDPTGELFCQLADAGAVHVHLSPTVSRRGHHGRYRVTWALYGREWSAEGWSPAVALRAAVRLARAESAHRRRNRAS